MLHQLTNFSICLPAEALERRRRDLRHVEVLVRVLLLQQNNLDDDDVHGIADGRIFVKRRHHVHDRQQIRLDVAVLVELHHRRIGDDERLDVPRRYHRSGDATLALLLITMIPYFAATLNDNL